MDDDFLGSFKNFVQERVSNPLFVSFLFFWITYNWKLIFYFIYSEEAIEVKLIYLEGISSVGIINNILIPLIFAGFYVVSMPWLLVGADFALKMVDEKRHKNKIKALTNRAIARRELIQAEADLKEIINSQSAISDLNKKITVIEEGKMELKKEYDSIQEKMRLAMDVISDATSRIDDYEDVVDSFVHIKEVIREMEGLLGKTNALPSLAGLGELTLADYKGKLKLLKMEVEQGQKYIEKTSASLKDVLNIKKTYIRNQLIK